jgi:SAM-dependent methyltransferase
MTKRLWDLLWKTWYPVLTRLTRGSRVVFLNYGYGFDTATDGPTLHAEDEPDRICIQLYDRVARSIDLRGLDVLEVSCGHGGGASYVARYLQPRSVHGVDRNARAVDLCRASHRVGGLAFSQGDALALGFADGSFDAVVNVEASHCYPDVPRFLREVHRVLRPGGHLLYADFRPANADVERLRSQLAGSGMDVVRCDDISPNVVRGMELNHDRSVSLIGSLVPRPLRPFARSFAGVKGSTIYQALRGGTTVYLHCVLRKRAESAHPGVPSDRIT